MTGTIALRWCVALSVLGRACTTSQPRSDFAQNDEGTASAAGVVDVSSFFSITLGREYHYQVYLPPAFSESEAYPVMYLLHGRGDTMAAWNEFLPNLDRLITAGTIPPLIAVMPEVPSSERASYYVDSYYTGPEEGAQERPEAGEAVESAFIGDLIPHIDERLPTIVDRRGRVVAGYSMGGFGAVRALFAYPEVFSAGVVLSPAVYTPTPPRDSSTRMFGAFGVADRLFDSDRYQELNYPVSLESYRGGRFPTKVFIAVGDDEWKHPESEDAMHDLDIEAHFLFNRLSRVSGVTAEFRVYDGGHDWRVWNRGMEEGLRFLVNHLRFSRHGWSNGESGSNSIPS